MNRVMKLTIIYKSTEYSVDDFLKKNNLSYFDSKKNTLVAKNINLIKVIK